MNQSDRSTPGDADVGPIARLIGDPNRARILMALADGQAHPASELAASAGLTRSAATNHLRQLSDGDLVRVEQVGRFRLHSLAGPDVGRLVEALAALAPTQHISSLSASNKAAALRESRTCYDHLAGRLGVAVTAALRFHEALEFVDPTAEARAGGSTTKVCLGPQAHTVFSALDIDLASSASATRRAGMRLCLDWSERRFHLAGALGATMLDSWLRHRWLVRSSERSVQLTAAGRAHLINALPALQSDGRRITPGQ